MPSSSKYTLRCLLSTHGKNGTAWVLRQQQHAHTHTHTHTHTQVVSFHQGGAYADEMLVPELTTWKVRQRAAKSKMEGTDKGLG